MKKIVAILLTMIIIGVLLIGVEELPKFGKQDNPANNYVMEKYIEDGVKDTGALNIVTGIILDYRAFDTFAEATVLFTGAIAVLMVFKKEE
ncbi:hydrogen gas-evolving membrane-bound hydrogenase subunit E [Crassaminicella profunda]|uniref:hydrogen gas-evolving membrane-bound hydrogenase subunit E n=1 Tax=Crassaminicella profunda TaxID=1286698 RepID=UPI001CA798CA|nr:hydrogen gas-evolving membrane-bound hydrogenase subunit E [Crassaminicella profunda]QZY55286.1 hypothetical protein K7H06_20170 [Crassaminicella profunda]